DTLNTSKSLVYLAYRLERRCTASSGRSEHTFAVPMKF
ncbi:hypothetical protein LCGC14_3133650, partial [marine sediment metagenome]